MGIRDDNFSLLCLYLVRESFTHYSINKYFRSPLFPVSHPRDPEVNPIRLDYSTVNCFYTLLLGIPIDPCIQIRLCWLSRFRDSNTPTCGTEKRFLCSDEIQKRSHSGRVTKWINVNVREGIDSWGTGEETHRV